MVAIIKIDVLFFTAIELCNLEKKKHQYIVVKKQVVQIYLSMSLNFDNLILITQLTFPIRRDNLSP